MERKSSFAPRRFTAAGGEIPDRGRGKASFITDIGISHADRPEFTNAGSPSLHGVHITDFRNKCQRPSVTEFRCNTAMTIGERIRERRVEMGMDVVDLAKAAGIAPSTLYDLERGDSKSSKKLHALADKLLVRTAWLETGKGQKFLAEQAGNGDMTPVSRSDATHPQTANPALRRVSVRGSIAMDGQGFWELGEEEAQPYMWRTDDEGTYAIRLLTQRFEPKIQPGECLLVSPAAELKIGRGVVVILKDGRQTYRNLRKHEYGHWYFVDVNDPGAFLDLPDDQVAQVHRVMSVFWTD